MNAGAVAGLRYLRGEEHMTQLFSLFLILMATAVKAINNQLFKLNPDILFIRHFTFFHFLFDLVALLIKGLHSGMNRQIN